MTETATYGFTHEELRAAYEPWVLGCFLDASSIGMVALALREPDLRQFQAEVDCEIELRTRSIFDQYVRLGVHAADSQEDMTLVRSICTRDVMIELLVLEQDLERNAK